MGMPELPAAGTNSGLRLRVVSIDGATRVFSKGGLGDVSVRTLCAVTGGRNTTSIGTIAGTEERRAFDEMRIAIKIT
jgi:hypothetical protein